MLLICALASPLEGFRLKAWKARKAIRQFFGNARKDKAAVALAPTFGAGVIASAFSVYGELDLPELVGELRKQSKTVHNGDLKRAETMLTSQAHSLDAIFTNLARRAGLNAGEYIGACETYLKLALRAQSQCRATLETLATIKNPPVVFAKQANIAHGPQQVNNGVASEPARVAETANPPTELLGNDHGERMDTAATHTASASDPIMATVETVHRPTHAARKGRSKP